MACSKLSNATMDACPVCEGGLFLLGEVCPMCDGDKAFRDNVGLARTASKEWTTYEDVRKKQRLCDRDESSCDGEGGHHRFDDGYESPCEDEGGNCDSDSDAVPGDEHGRHQFVRDNDESDCAVEGENCDGSEVFRGDRRRDSPRRDADEARCEDEKGSPPDCDHDERRVEEERGAFHESDDDDEYSSSEEYDDEEEEEEERESQNNVKKVWEIWLGSSWVQYDTATEMLIKEAEANGDAEVQYCARGQQYIIDLAQFVQINRFTGVCRRIRCVERTTAEHEDSDAQDAQKTPMSSRCPRVARLVNYLMTPAVQVQLPAEAVEEPELLSPEQVKKVFLTHVPGVERFLYREMPGQYSLNFIVGAYRDGLRAFKGTPVHHHLLWLFRLAVHYAHADKPSASRYLREVAEAFMDCQAVQSRVIERVGLEIRGVRSDFRGLVTRLVGDYKALAVKMLAHDRIGRGLAMDDGNPTHYENRLTADLGATLGLNMDDVRRATLDEHAAARFEPLRRRELSRAAERCRELFDFDALVKAFISEVNSFNEESSMDSLPRLFLEWAATRLESKHVVFDDTSLNVAIGQPFAQAVLEDLFLGHPAAPEEELYHGRRVQDLFA